MQIFIAKDKQQTGPFSEEQIQGMIASGMVYPTDLAWHEGLSGWLPLNQVLNVSPQNPQAAQPPPYPESTRSAAMPSSDAMFLYIPTGRLIGMSIATLGLYQAYWVYRNWRFLKDRDGLSIQPFWRGIFGVFFISSLLNKIKTDTAAIRIQPASFSPGGLAAGWIVLIILGNLLGRAPAVGANIFGIILSVSAVFCILPVQQYINALNESLPTRPAYYGWSTGHIVCLVVGIILWLLVMVGLTT